MQSVIRQVNRDIVEESLYDACDLTARFGTLYRGRVDKIFHVAKFLASKRNIDARTAYEEFARQQTWIARKPANGDQE